MFCMKNMAKLSVALKGDLARGDLRLFYLGPLSVQKQDVLISASFPREILIAPKIRSPRETSSFTVFGTHLQGT